MIDLDKKPINSVDYWNGNDRWYKLWVDHNNYHEYIIKTLKKIIQPGWKVLDIGGGGGVLALPLAMHDCEVVVLEPSWAMRELLSENIQRTHKQFIISMDTRRWEETEPPELCGYDLVMACNSLHLVTTGITDAFKKLFSTRVAHVFVVTEHLLNGLCHCAGASGYDLVFKRIQEKESSFVYHYKEEAFEHWKFMYGRYPQEMEREGILSRLTMENGHWWLKETVPVHMYYWKTMLASK